MIRYLYITLIVIFTLIVILFKFQNLDSVTVTFFTASITLPISVLIFIVYVLGMFTGGFLISLLKTWIKAAAKKTN